MKLKTIMSLLILATLINNINLLSQPNIYSNYVQWTKNISDIPKGIEIYNFTLNNTTPVKILDENINYAYFYISNDTDYTLLISTSTSFSTYFRIPKNAIFASDVKSTLYGKLETGTGNVSVMYEMSAEEQ